MSIRKPLSHVLWTKNIPGQITRGPVFPLPFSKRWQAKKDRCPDFRFPKARSRLGDQLQFKHQKGKCRPLTHKIHRRGWRSGICGWRGCRRMPMWKRGLVTHFGFLPLVAFLPFTWNAWRVRWSRDRRVPSQTRKEGCYSRLPSTITWVMIILDTLWNRKVANAGKSLWSKHKASLLHQECTYINNKFNIFRSD